MNSLANKNRLLIPLKVLSNHLLIKHDSINMLEDINSLRDNRIIKPHDIVFTIDDEKCSVGDSFTALRMNPYGKPLLEYIPAASTLSNVFSERMYKKKPNFI